MPTTLPLCVGPQHEFFLEWTGFDVPAGYTGVDGKPIGHVIIHAALQRDSPSVPCIDAVRSEMFTVSGLTATEYRCPPDSPRIERVARHGEGAYAGHLTLAWTRGGIVYLVSAHGYSTASRRLIEQLGASIALTHS